MPKKMKVLEGTFMPKKKIFSNRIHSKKAGSPLALAEEKLTL
jgi:hypothetical protein